MEGKVVVQKSVLLALVVWLLALTAVVAMMPRSASPISFGAYAPIPTPPPDAGLSLVENGQGPPATWQVPPQHVSTWTDVYINASTGQSTNLGTTFMSPWASNADLARAIGVYGKLSPPPVTPTPPAGGQWVTVHYDGAMPTDFLNPQFVLDANVCLHFVNDLVTTLHTGTITAATPYTNTSTLASVTDPGVADWTPYLKKRIQWTSGAAVGAYAWIGRDLGSGQVRISDPFTIFDVVATGRSFPQEVPPSTGTYVVQDLPQLFVGDVTAEATKQGNQIEPFVEFLSFSLPATNTVGAFPQVNGLGIDWNFQACSIGWQEPSGAPGYGFYGCCFPNGQVPVGHSFVYYVNCCFFQAMGCLDHSYCNYYSTLGMGTGLVILNGSVAEINNLAIDTPTTAYPNSFADGITTVKPSTAPGTFVSWGQSYLCGTGIAGAGIRVNAGTTDLIYYQVPSITGTLGDFELDSNFTSSSYSDATGSYSAGASIANTWANFGIDVTSGGFRNPSDYSNAGAHLPSHDAHLIMANP